MPDKAAPKSYMDELRAKQAAGQSPAGLGGQDTQQSAPTGPAPSLSPLVVLFASIGVANIFIALGFGATVLPSLAKVIVAAGGVGRILPMYLFIGLIVILGVINIICAMLYWRVLPNNNVLRVIAICISIASLFLLIAFAALTQESASIARFQLSIQ